MEQQWYCKIIGEVVGPVTSEDLVSMLARGQLDPTDPVRAGASGPWRPVKEILGAAMPQSLGGTATATAAPSATAATSATAAPSGGSSPDGYGFLDDIARLEDAAPEAPRRPASSRSSDDLLAGLADLEDADALDMIPDAPSRGSTQELLAGLADAEEPPPPPPSPNRPQNPGPPRNVPAPAAAPQANPAAMLEMVQRLDAEYQRLRAQLTGGTPIETNSWHGQRIESGSWPGQPVESGSWHGQPHWPGQPAPSAHGPAGYPQTPPPQHGWPPQQHAAPLPPLPQGWAVQQPPAAPPRQAPAAQPQPPAPAQSAPAQSAPAVKLPPPPAAEPPRAPEPPKPAPSPPRPPEATAPKAQFDAGSTTSAATDALRDMAAAHIRASQASSGSSSFSRPSYGAPAKKSKGGGGGFSFDVSSIDFTSKPVIITAAVVGLLVLGYFGMNMGFLSGMSAGPVYDETLKFYKEFQTASAKGPESAEFTAFYTKWKKAQPDLLKKLGSPKPGSTAANVKQATMTLGSRIESFKLKLDKPDQQMYEDSLKSKLDQLKKEFGR